MPVLEVYVFREFKQKTVMYPLLDLEVFMCVAVTNLTLVLPALGVYVTLGNQRINCIAKLLGQAQYDWL